MKEIKLNKDYYVILERRDTLIWKKERMCYFHFLNSFHLPILSIITNEDDIRRLVENVYEFIEFQESYITVYFNISSLMDNLNSFGFEFIQGNDIFQVIEYNIYTDFRNPRLKISLNENYYDLKDFITDIYYEFLGDKSEYIYLSPDFLN